MITTPAPIFGRLDRFLPEDNRTDAEIEADVQERLAEQRRRQRQAKVQHNEEQPTKGTK